MAGEQWRKTLSYSRGTGWVWLLLIDDVVILRWLTRYQQSIADLHLLHMIALLDDMRLAARRGIYMDLYSFFVSRIDSILLTIGPS